MAEAPLRVVLAQPRGFCAGVERAIEIVERAITKYGPPVYVRHEIVHNRHVVEMLKQRGARFVEEVDEIPTGAVTVFSAHGVATLVERWADERSLHVIDATCPLVTKVHREGQRYARAGYDVVLIGHKGHPEVEGTLGQIDGPVHLVPDVAAVAAVTPRDPARIAYVTQTTLSVDDTRDIIRALTERFPAIVGPDVKDICYATQNRQSAVRALAERVDLILVVGARNSSNSNRLREIGALMGRPAHLIDGPQDLDPAWLDGVAAVGVTAGASAPEVLVRGVVERLSALRTARVETLDGIREDVHFKLPDELVAAAPLSEPAVS
ncbi:4-hydroxy-3-methylbut-2-enyl diphosphate reductase [Azospirillum sp. RWY-5-1]|uniref:4-hydroxy-3-methylbut-2-enyl diphosphate reductase n=1 Tax=Azospirillum oleiclasticum TaxID=2735135 RepID=A0ABX2TJM8_9PROT|nr:4-hydroxy-3-methylbut-2-enyl diphosphate reductase [Azospirillum oleiclasticum]NYZ16721.1 4-hydroxy-3-methylbut-2-enyl diphosphate reductase [Azospirillum oleiclasticum]NYZ23377.1 4-hydroxy-3-methylbut-2-enyl diphosphate reductase [Azospirillum oleiclasticum]